MTSPNKNVHPTSMTITRHHVTSIKDTLQYTLVENTTAIILHLCHYQWKDGLTLVCVGVSEDMDLERHFTIALFVIII